jgi:hypothetical protein
VGWLDGKGVSLKSKSQGIKPHEWCCVWSTDATLSSFLDSRRIQLDQIAELDQTTEMLGAQSALPNLQD